MTGPLVGWHQGRMMRLDEIGDHMKRIQQVEPEIKQAVITDRVLGGIVPDLLNEIDRLRFLLTERDRVEPVKPGMVADDCGWCRGHGYTAGQQLTPRRRTRRGNSMTVERRRVMDVAATKDAQALFAGLQAAMCAMLDLATGKDGHVDQRSLDRYYEAEDRVLKALDVGDVYGSEAQLRSTRESQ